jgi:starvation-inducible DNA-binding protein
MKTKNRAEAVERRKAPLNTPSGLGPKATRDISGALNALLADVFALYMKAKNFHWHMSGSHFYPWHGLLDAHAEELLSMTDQMAERVRKVGGTTLRSIAHIARLQRLKNNEADFVTPLGMLAELQEDTVQLIAEMRAAHVLCSDAGDVGSSSFLETWIDQAERRAWFLFESLRK